MKHNFKEMASETNKKRKMKTDAANLAEEERGRLLSAEKVSEYHHFAVSAAICECLRDAPFIPFTCYVCRSIRSSCGSCGSRG